MNRTYLLAAAALALTLGACDKVRLPGADMGKSAEAPAGETPVAPTETPVDADTGPAETDIADDPAPTPDAETPEPEAVEWAEGDRFVRDGKILEHRQRADGTWAVAQIADLAGNEGPDGAFHEGESLRNGVMIANAVAADWRAGDRFVRDGKLFERKQDDAGEWTEADLGLVDLVVEAPSGAETPDASTLTLAGLNAARCGLPADAVSTPTVATVAGATELAEPVVGAEAVNAVGAQLSSFPGIVKLEPRRAEAGGAIASGHCGATRIAENWLVTAAHCVDQPYDELRIIGDAENLRSPAAKITDADLAVCHAGYQGTANGYANDIALLHLTPEEVARIADVPIARFGATQKPLAPANYTAADMAGWGLTRFGGQLSADLLTANLGITGTGPAVIYVTSKGGAGPCVGDSGGPLYVTEEDGTKTVVGVLSVVEQNKQTGEFCAGDYAGRYTNLQGFDAWMRSVMSLCDSNEEMCR